MLFFFHPPKSAGARQKHRVRGGPPTRFRRGAGGGGGGPSAAQRSGQAAAVDRAQAGSVRARARARCRTRCTASEDHLQTKHCKTAAGAGLEFRVGLGEVSACGFVECDTGFTGGSGAGFAVAVDGAHQGSVDCDLRAVPQRQSANEDFDRTCVGGRRGEVHVPQENVCTDRAPCFAAYPGHGAFHRDGAKESGGGTGGAMVSQRIKGAAAAAAVVEGVSGGCTPDMGTGLSGMEGAQSQFQLWTGGVLDFIYSFTDNLCGPWSHRCFVN